MLSRRIAAPACAAVAALACLPSGAAAAIRRQSASAQPSIVYACVKHGSGAVRIVRAKTRCRRNERKLSWNVDGPAGQPGPRGATGATGATGANGAAGAVADFSLKVEKEQLAVNKSEESLETPVAIRSLPAGAYLVTAKLDLVALQAETFGVDCELLDGAGPLSFEEQSQVLDAGSWAYSIKPSAGEYSAATTLSLAGTLSSSAPTKIGIVCVASGTGKSLTISAADIEFNALQVSQIR